MSKLNWLHLSDWHQRGADFNRKVVREKLIDDIQNRTRVDEALAEIDLVVFSGDVAFAGQEAEYKTARTELFEPVLAATSLTPDRLFIVPGNHDLDRNLVDEMLPSALQKPLKTPEEVNHWLSNERRRTRLLEPFEAYTQFIRDFTSQSEPAFASLKTLHIRGISVGLLGLNSALMSARERDAEGNVNDNGYLIIGEPQIHDTLKHFATHDIRIAVVHHPFEWLAEFDRGRVAERIQKSAHFILHGHEHLPDVRAISGMVGNWIRIPAGASYDRRDPEQPRYANSYNYCCLRIDLGRADVFLRRWSDRQTAWIEDADAHDHGRFEFKLPEDLTAPTVLQKLADGETKAPALERDKAAERYRNLMLENCDIVDLANLPERDRHLAARQLELRRLYVPLRTRRQIVSFWIKDSTGNVVVEDDNTTLLHRWARQTVNWDQMISGSLKIEKSWSLPRNLQRYWHESRTVSNRVSIGERLKESRRLVILGDPGAGKTTLTRWIATAYLLKLKADADWKDLPDVQTLPDTDWLPIIVRCRDLDGGQSSDTLDAILMHTLERTALSASEISPIREYLLEEVKNNRVILILDGLDEISESLNRTRFCERIESIVTAYPELPVIATSRIVGYREMGRRLGRGFEHLTLADLTREEKDEFARRWSALTEIPVRRATAADELILDIHSSDRIERLTGNPMLLTTMALVKRRVGKLPQRRADLYWEAVQVLLNWRREVDAPIDHREAIPQLEYLAYAMCDRGVQRLRDEEVLQLFEQMRAEYPNVHAVHARKTEEFLRVLEARTGMLVEAGHQRFQGRPVPIYEFRHLTFQEYLAALALVDGRFPGRNSDRSLAQNIASLAGRTTQRTRISRWVALEEPTVVESWRETLRLCVSICNDDDVDGVLRAILVPLKGEPKATRGARLLLAASCLADEPNASTSVASDIANVFAVQSEEQGALRSGGLTRAALELANTRWALIFIEALLKAYFSCSADRREGVGAVLGAISWGSPRGTTARDEWLRFNLEDIREGDERTAVLAMLGLIWGIAAGTSDSVQLKRGLTGALMMRLDGTAPVAHAAAWTLGSLGTGLIRTETEWKPGDRRWRPSPRQLQAILELFLRLRDNGYALWWISWLLGNSFPKEVSERLVVLLQSRDQELAIRVAAALRSLIGKTAATDALIGTLVSDKRSPVRLAAVRALRASVDPSTIAALRDLFDSEIDREVKDEIFSCIAQHFSATDRRLMSRDLDGDVPFLKVGNVIEFSHVEKAAKELDLSLHDAQRRVEQLSKTFGIQIAWSPDFVPVVQKSSG